MSCLFMENSLRVMEKLERALHNSSSFSKVPPIIQSDSPILLDVQPSSPESYIVLIDLPSHERNIFQICFRYFLQNISYIFLQVIVFLLD